MSRRGQPSRVREGGDGRVGRGRRAGERARRGLGPGPTVLVRRATPPVVISSANGNVFKNGGPRTGVEEAFEPDRHAARTCSTRSSPASTSSSSIPTEDGVGYGGPAQRGRAWCSSTPAACTGPSKRAGGVAALEGVRTPSLVAQGGARSTPTTTCWSAHGAQDFARQHGLHDRGRPQHRELAEEVAGVEAAHRSRPLARSGEARREAGERGVAADGGRGAARPAAPLRHHQLRRRRPEGRGVRRHHHERPRLQDPGPGGRLADPRRRAVGRRRRWARPARPAAARPTSTTCPRSSSSRRCGAGLAPKDAAMEALRRVKANTVEKRLLTPQGDPGVPADVLRGRQEGRVRGRVDVREDGPAARRVRGLHREGRRDAPCEPLFEGAPPRERRLPPRRGPPASAGQPPLFTARFFMMCGFTFTVFLSAVPAAADRAVPHPRPRRQHRARRRSSSACSPTRRRSRRR